MSDDISAYMERENAKQSKKLSRVHTDDWPKRSVKNLVEVWRSKTFLLQVYVDNESVRLTVCRSAINQNGWVENITWDELQQLKRECGYGDRAAVEIYPPDDDVVNVANMRHLWLLKEPPHFMWKRAA